MGLLNCEQQNLLRSTRMCGIIGYTGKSNAAAILLEGLRRLEYRGYDSAGMAVIESDSIQVKKGVGKVDETHERFNFTSLSGNTGIAHTRWATHGGVTWNNAHPHTSCKEEVAVVHNGIIENYQELRSVLVKRGHIFKSETDSEVIAHLLEEKVRAGFDKKTTLLDTVKELQGSFALVIIFSDEPKTIFGARKDSPLVIGIGRGENFLASDTLAFLEKTDRVVFLDNMEIAVVGKSGFSIFTFDGYPVVKEVTQVAWEIGDLSKKEFTHYTLKEIHEQPYSLRTAFYQEPQKIEEFSNAIRAARRIYLLGCGTSFHAGLIGKYLLAKLAKIPAEAIIGSEIDQYADIIDNYCLILTISQSGETADVLHAVKVAKDKGAKVLSLVNAVGSSLVRVSSISMSINCGPEVGVAATKSFTSQLALLYLIAMNLADSKLEIQTTNKLLSAVEQVLRVEENVAKIAENFLDNSDFYLIGRGIHHPIALEGALKLKELAYVHAEGMAAGELKHGTLALIQEGTPVIVLNPCDETYQETISNAVEMKSRGARIIGISDRPNEVYDGWIEIPSTDTLFYPLVEVIPLQLLAYYSALKRQSNPDYPRNLAKSVTVK